MTAQEIELRKEYEQIKDQPMFFENGRLNHRLAALSAIIGLLDGIADGENSKAAKDFDRSIGKAMKPKEIKQNSKQYPWKRRKRR
jgi:hypothetical protein